MPAGKIKESLWLGTARIFLSSARGQGGVRQLDGALGGLWGLGRPPKPKRPRVQVPAESNQGEIWECHSCSQQRCSVAQLALSLFLSPTRSCPTFPSMLHVSPPPPPVTFLDRHAKKRHSFNMKPEVYVLWYARMCERVRVWALISRFSLSASLCVCMCALA